MTAFEPVNHATYRSMRAKGPQLAAMTTDDHLRAALSRVLEEYAAMERQYWKSLGRLEAIRETIAMIDAENLDPTEGPPLPK
ncbi:hypothetical protein [Iamia sp.]|uniref:hypothetical protein n=1 Tax=Iamia sp. TaxID=2722710 RepID=UPI002CDA5589|nr:hypothetical protein [Iamia sp.]HXH56593.1 hypothetical protein [Iamia sp.]